MNEKITAQRIPLDEEKRIRRMYQALLERRPLKYWSILDFPYLAEIVRYDTNYLKRILSFVFVDHPALSQYLMLIAWKEMAKDINKITGDKQINTMPEVLPIGFERTLWTLYKRQKELSDLWAVTSEMTNIACEDLKCLTFQEFIAKISGSVVRNSLLNTRQ